MARRASCGMRLMRLMGAVEERSVPLAKRCSKWTDLIAEQVKKGRGSDHAGAGPGFHFPRKNLRVLCGYFEYKRRVQFEGCVAEPLPTITEEGNEEKSKVMASCSYLEEKFQECSKREGVGLTTTVEIKRVDPRTSTKPL